jgi:hypothetical protein
MPRVTAPTAEKQAPVGLHTCEKCGAAIQYDDPHRNCGRPSRVATLTPLGRAEAFRQKYGVEP